MDRPEKERQLTKHPLADISPPSWDRWVFLQPPAILSLETNVRRCSVHNTQGFSFCSMASTRPARSCPVTDLLEGSNRTAVDEQ